MNKFTKVLKEAHKLTKEDMQWLKENSSSPCSYAQQLGLNIKFLMQENKNNKPKTEEREKMIITQNTINGIKVEGHKGTWGVIDYKYDRGEEIFLLEHDYYGENALCVIVNAQGRLLMEDVSDGFNDWDEEYGN